MRRRPETPAVVEVPVPPRRRVLVVLDSDDDDDFDPRDVARSLITASGEGSRRARTKSVGEGSGSGTSGRRRAVEVASERPRGPRAESSRRPAVAVVRAPSPPEVVDVDGEQLGVVLLIGGRGEGVARVKEEEPYSGSESDGNEAGGRARVPVAAAKQRKRGRKAPSRAQERRVGVRVKEEPYSGSDSDGNGAGGRAVVPAAASKQRKRGREAPSRAQESRVGVRLKEEPYSGSHSDGNGAGGRAVVPAAASKQRKRGREAPSRAQESRVGVRLKEEPYSGSHSDGNGAGGRAVVPAAASKQRKRGREAPSRAQESRVGVRLKEEPYSGSDSDGNGAGGRALVPVTTVKQRKRGGKTSGRAQERRTGDTPTSTARSNGAPFSCKARGRGRGRSRQRSEGAVRSCPTPVSRVTAGVGSRTRSRSSKQGRVQYRKYFAREEVVAEEEEEEEDNEEEEMVVSSDDNENGNGEINGENGNGEINGENSNGEINGEGRGTEDDVEETEEKGSGTDEDGASDDSDENFSEKEDDDESEEEDDDDDDDDDEEPDEARDETAEAGEQLPSRSGNRGRRLIGKRMFEGLYFPEQVDTTDGSNIRARTRSNFKHKKLLDKKLLKRGTFSKPYCIDVSESSSGSEEPQPEQAQGQPAYSGEDSEDDGGCGDNEEHRAVKRRKLNRTQSAHSDSEADATFVSDIREGSGSRRGQKGTSHKQASREGGKKKDGSTPQHVGNNGAKAGRQTNGLNGQSDVSFKRNAEISQKRKCGRARADQEKYGHLLDPMFDEIENNQYEPVPEEQIDKRLLLIFAFGDEDELEENSKHNKLQDEDELWTEFDFALESIHVCSHNCEEDEKNDEQEIPADKAASCNQGKHQLIIDEQIGVRCKHCHFVDLEIRFVLPSMVKSYTEREMKKDHELDLFFDDILTSAGYEGPHDFGGHKTGLVWDLIPGVWEDMFPHQREGFEFMWRKLAGGTSIEQLKHTMNTIEGGCVISHAPGTGKTRLAITFVQSYFEFFPKCCPVIIAPRGMLATWEQEFRKWKVKVPFHVLNSNEINWNEDKTIKDLATMDENLAQSLARNKLDQKFRRKLKLASWRKGSSIIGVSYSLFRKLANHEGIDGLMVRNLLLEKPDLLVLDEGHTPRNKKSLLWKVLAKVRTEKRVILSGTPFQNNFLELYNILYLVRPKFARDFASKSFKKRRFASRTSRSRDALLEKDEGKDFWTSLTLNNITEENIDEIRKILDPIVHIHNGDILQKSLPGLRESVVILNPLPHQKEIIIAMENTVAMGTLDSEYKISLASIHPSLITCARLSEKETSCVNVSLLKSLRPNPCEGVKTRFVLEIVRLCEAMKERVLVFSQYLEPLSLIMDQLSKMFNWTEGKEILLMSGNVLVKNREALMEAFNDMKSDAKVMLASTKACCEGITLIGASRVVLLDVVWNPSVGRQAIGRAYRIGQEKIVHTYNLITEGTKEKDKYDRQARKDQMSKLLFLKEPQPAGFNLSQEVIFNDKILEAMTSHGELKDMFVKILHSY